jgi:hypothetical protein
VGGRLHTFELQYFTDKYGENQWVLCVVDFNWYLFDTVELADRFHRFHSKLPITCVTCFHIFYMKNHHSSQIRKSETSWDKIKIKYVFRKLNLDNGKRAYPNDFEKV